MRPTWWFPVAVVTLLALRDETGEITVVPTARVDGARTVASEFRQDGGRGGNRLEKHELLALLAVVGRSAS